MCACFWYLRFQFCYLDISHINTTKSESTNYTDSFSQSPFPLGFRVHPILAAMADSQDKDICSLFNDI